MADLRFPRWLAAVGILGGVMIALILPLTVLMLGHDFSPGIKLVIIILALIFGAGLAAISAVVGITIPTAVAGGALEIAGAGCRRSDDDRFPPAPDAATADD